MRKNPITYVDTFYDPHSRSYWWQATDGRKKYNSTRVFPTLSAAMAAGMIWAKRRNSRFNSGRRKRR